MTQLSYNTAFSDQNDYIIVVIRMITSL